MSGEVAQASDPTDADGAGIDEGSPTGAVAVDERPGQPAEPRAGAHAPKQRAARAARERAGQRPHPLRPWLFAAAVGLLVLAIVASASAVGYGPYSHRVRYGLYFAAMVVAVGCVGAVALARRQGRTWDADLLPALAGGLGSLVVLVSLHGTPFDMNGLVSDQTYRTQSVTRFADSWRLMDYGYAGEPTFYPPLYFWLLGRVAALAQLAPFHMLKLGTVVAAFVAPIIAYLMWRRIVSVRVAAMIAFVPLVAEQIWEPYGWLVLAAIIPWWLDAIHGLTRPGLRPRNPVLLGLIGAALFCTYYYYFFVFAIVWCAYLLVQWRLRELRASTLRRPALILGVAALAATPYWVPLVWHVVTTPGFEPLNNWWLRRDAGVLSLPMLNATYVGALCLLGLGFLAWTAREALSRSLLIITAALYVWHAIGFPFLVIDQPLLSHRMRAMVPVVLLIAAVIALPRLARHVRARVPWRESGQLFVVGALVLGLAVTTGFVTRVWGSEAMAAAHNETLPDGKLPTHHRAGAKADLPAPDAVHAVIEANRSWSGHAIVASTRTDLFLFYPYFTFVAPNALYSHPSARFHDRVAFLRDLAAVRDPQEFARRCADNPYDRIDAFVLQKMGTTWRLRVSDIDYPYQKKWVSADFAPESFDTSTFVVTELDGYVVAVRRPAGLSQPPKPVTTPVR